MPSYHETRILGHAGADEDLRYTANGKAVSNVSVAVSDKMGGDEHTEWYKCVIWGGWAENLNCEKGDLIEVHGRILTEKWQDREGNDRWTPKLHANRAFNLTRKDDRGGSPKPSSQKEPTQDDPPTGSHNGEFDDDIPF